VVEHNNFLFHKGLALRLFLYSLYSFGLAKGWAEEKNAYDKEWPKFSEKESGRVGRPYFKMLHQNVQVTNKGAPAAG
jgi:hypothetical protein